MSRTVRDLVVGSGLTFDPRGVHTLKGVDDVWELFALAPAVNTPLSVAPDEPQTEASDRVVLAAARRAPAVLRLAARMRATAARR